MKLQSLNSTEVLGFFRSTKLSIFEILFLIAAVLFAAVVTFFYFMKVQPLNSEVSRLQGRERELRGTLDKKNTDEKKRGEQSSNAEKILESLNRFENYLKPDERGMTQIINEIDALGKTHKVITGDTTFRVAEPDATTDENGNPKPVAANNDKQIRIYPSLGMDTSVVGDYQNLRRFLSDLERSKQFLIINSLSFQGEADRVRRVPAAAGNAQPGQLGQLSSPEAIPVSLKIELETYFQKSANKGQ